MSPGGDRAGVHPEGILREVGVSSSELPADLRQAPDPGWWCLINKGGTRPQEDVVSVGLVVKHCPSGGRMDLV